MARHGTRAASTDMPGRDGTPLLLALCILGCGHAGSTSEEWPFRTIADAASAAATACLPSDPGGGTLVVTLPPCFCPGSTACEVQALENGDLDVAVRVVDAMCDACMSPVAYCALPTAPVGGSVGVRFDGRPAFRLTVTAQGWGPTGTCWAAPPDFAIGAYVPGL